MTEKYPPASIPPSEWDEPVAPLSADEDQGTADVVKDQAADLGHGTVQAGKRAVAVAQEQASGVAAEAGRQGRDLLRQAQEELGQQAAHGQRRLAGELLALSDELNSMADGPGQGGVAVGLARQAAARTRDAGQWLDDRRPAQVVGDVQSFARRRPGVFLALAVGAGLVAGRFTRGLTTGDDEAGIGGTP
ncbi:MAG: hypothetical protein QOJ73_4253 [Streptosporangiaceae bacterium]|jgi:hypothetical protein|nr:hypothetical protein [Streptosporangiaceae bacterium]